MDDDPVDSGMITVKHNVLMKLSNGITIKKITKPRILWYVSFNIKTDIEDYYREWLMLCLPWREEERGLILTSPHIRNTT